MKLILAAFCALALAQAVAPKSDLVRPGIEVFLSDVPQAIRGKRVGLITNHAGIDRAGTPDIDPAKHRLAIHGMVKQPLVFTMDDLHRYPSVSRFYFLECSGNGLTDWLKPASTTERGIP